MGDDTETARGSELRRTAFLRAGFPEDAAAALAARPEIAYLDAVALLRHGFPAEVASAMLLGGGRPVF